MILNAVSQEVYHDALAANLRGYLYTPAASRKREAALALVSHGAFLEVPQTATSLGGYVAIPSHAGHTEDT